MGPRLPGAPWRPAGERPGTLPSLRGAPRIPFGTLRPRPVCCARLPPPRPGDGPPSAEGAGRSRRPAAGRGRSAGNVPNRPGPGPVAAGARPAGSRHHPGRVSCCPARSVGPAAGRGGCYRQSRRLARPARPPSLGPSWTRFSGGVLHPSLSLDTARKLWDRTTPKAAL